jgi:predicted metal-dependent peptidase
METEKLIYRLLKSEPFFANFLLSAKLVLNEPRIQTAGASVQKGQIVFYFNPEFMTKHPIEEQMNIMKHEVFHVLLDHCGNRNGGKGNKMAKNIAMDCAINQHLRPLPKDCITLQSVEKMVKKNLKPLECWEYYYDQMKQACKDSSEPHDHDMMEEGEETPEEEAMRKATVKDAAAKAWSASAGNVPEALSGIIAKMNAPAQLPWKQVLRNFVANARVVLTKPSRLKPHRRFELDQPGRKKLRKLILGVCVDSSGSVSDEAYAKFMNEIASLSKNTSITYLVHADCEVQRVSVIKGGKPKKGELSERHGNGGTAYQPAINECLKRDCDAIIYFGDMDAADKPKNPGVPFIWVRVGNSTPPGAFGKILDLV